MYPFARSAVISGRLTLYAWKDSKTKRNGMAFRSVPQAADEWPVGMAQWRVDQVLGLGHNVMIENGKGEIVFLANQGFVEFPADVAAFWRECGK